MLAHVLSFVLDVKKPSIVFFDHSFSDVGNLCVIFLYLTWNDLICFPFYYQTIHNRFGPLPSLETVPPDFLLNGCQGCVVYPSRIGALPPP